MVGVHKRRETWVSTAADNQEDIDNNGVPESYCPHCLKYGFYRLLGPRLYPKAELINGEKPSDWEMWMSCSVCGSVYAVIHSKLENEIIGVKEVPDSIHDPKKLEINHFVEPRRNSNRKVKRVDRTTRPEDTDPDVKPKVQSGSKLVSYNTSDR